MLYNQTKQKETYYSCTIYTILHMLKFDFCVNVEDSLILRLVAKMEAIGALLPKGAYFAVIYPAVVKFINLRYGIKLKIEKSSISAGLDKKNSWSLGIKGFSSLGLKKGTNDRLMSLSDIKDIIKNKDKGSGHNHMIKYDKKGRWIIVDSWGGAYYQIKLSVLQYAMTHGLYYNTARRIVPADETTKRIKDICLKRYKHYGRLIDEKEFKEIVKIAKKD